MIRKYLLIIAIALTVFACGKDKDDTNDTYFVSASKVIDITDNNWDHTAPLLNNKRDYRYMESTPDLSAIIKAEVHLPAIDDSNRAVNGTILLNVAPDNNISYAVFDTDPLPKAEAYAMLMNYNHESLQTLTGITFTIGEALQDGIGSNPSVAVVLSKVNNGEEAGRLGVSYTAAQGSFTAVVFRQDDGRYIFSFRGRP